MKKNPAKLTGFIGFYPAISDLLNRLIDLLG